MSRASTRSFFMLAALCAAGAAQADSGVKWHIMGGYSDTLGNTANYLQGGPIFAGGFSIQPQWLGPFEMRFDLSYSEYNASIALINSGQVATNQPLDGGTGSIWSAGGNLLYHVPVAYGVRAYGIAGVGVYHTRIDLTQALPYGGGYYGYGYGYGYGCCGYAEAVVASHGVTDFGWTAGAGVEFALPYGHSWFIETRYQHINSTSTIEYLPIMIGYRF